ncbi:MAG: hypothetical protein U0791_11285 [Gemmataceae bacterium]
MNVVFADSFYWFALLNRKDLAHAKAIDFTNGFDGNFLTTEWIVTELADGWSKPPTRPFFATTLKFMDSEPKIDASRRRTLSGGLASHCTRIVRTRSGRSRTAFHSLS